MTLTAVTEHRAQLGEGPFWDAPTQALYWVDIAGKQALRLIGANVQIWQMPEHVSAFIPCQSGDALVTLSSGVYRLDLDSPGLDPQLRLFCVADPQPGTAPMKPAAMPKAGCGSAPCKIILASRARTCPSNDVAAVCFALTAMRG